MDRSRLRPWDFKDGVTWVVLPDYTAQESGRRTFQLKIVHVNKVFPFRLMRRVREK